MHYIVIALVCLAASGLGAVCGIGGGVIIKPVLDVMGVMPVATVCFLSGITVLCMSTYSVFTASVRHEWVQIKKAMLVLSLGASAGGAAGKLLFEQIRNNLPDPQKIGCVQAVALLLLTMGTFLYTIKKQRIHTLHVESTAVSLGAGVILGILSSFLGIGGGPFNFMILNYLFSMETKDAARTSLFIIMCSQICSLILCICRGAVPEFSVPVLVLMAAMGILGGIAGRAWNRKIQAQTVDQLFLGIVCIIMLICVVNTIKYW